MRPGAALMAEPLDALPPLVAERRDTFRQKTLLKGKIVYADGAYSMNCVIRDMSRTGARIALAKGESIPTRVFLIDMRSGTAYECVVAWIRVPQYGLRFVHQHNLQYVSNPSLAFLKRLWTGSGAAAGQG